MDQSIIDTSADEAISQIIHGALNIGACYCLVDRKSRFTSSRGGKCGAKKMVEQAGKWKQHVRKRVE